MRRFYRLPEPQAVRLGGRSTALLVTHSGYRLKRTTRRTKWMRTPRLAWRRRRRKRRQLQSERGACEAYEALSPCPAPSRVGARAPFFTTSSRAADDEEEKSQSEEEGVIAAFVAGEEEATATIDETYRLAVVDLEWERIRAIDILAVRSGGGHPEPCTHLSTRFCAHSCPLAAPSCASPSIHPTLGSRG